MECKLFSWEGLLITILLMFYLYYVFFVVTNPRSIRNMNSICSYISIDEIKRIINPYFLRHMFVIIFYNDKSDKDNSIEHSFSMERSGKGWAIWNIFLSNQRFSWHLWFSFLRMLEDASKWNPKHKWTDINLFRAKRQVLNRILHIQTPSHK